MIAGGIGGLVDLHDVASNTSEIIDRGYDRETYSIDAIAHEHKTRIMTLGRVGMTGDRICSVWTH